MDVEEIEGLVALAREHGLWIVFDQVYADMVYDKPMAYPQALTDGFERTLVVDSFSKSFGMTGWRLGYLALPPGIAKSAVKFIQHSIYCVPSFIQLAGVQALELADELLCECGGGLVAVGVLGVLHVLGIEADGVGLPIR